jgi:hypothetical protein
MGRPATGPSDPAGGSAETDHGSALTAAPHPRRQRPSQRRRFSPPAGAPHHDGKVARASPGRSTRPVLADARTGEPARERRHRALEVRSLPERRPPPPHLAVREPAPPRSQSRVPAPGTERRGPAPRPPGLPTSAPRRQPESQAPFSSCPGHEGARSKDSTGGFFEMSPCSPHRGGSKAGRGRSALNSGQKKGRDPGDHGPSLN